MMDFPCSGKRPNWEGTGYELKNHIRELEIKSIKLTQCVAVYQVNGCIKEYYNAKEYLKLILKDIKFMRYCLPEFERDWHKKIVIIWHLENKITGKHGNSLIYDDVVSLQEKNNAI